jgi:hypothetical protein
MAASYVEDLPEIRRPTPRRAPESPVNPNFHPITQADIDCEVERLRARKAAGEVEDAD